MSSFKNVPSECVYRNVNEEKLIRAIRVGSKKDVSRLLVSGVNPNFICDLKDSPLVNCIYYNQLAIAKALVNAGADVNAQNDIGWSVLHYAINQKNIRLFNFFLKCGIDVNQVSQNGNTPLHFVSEREEFEKYFEALLKKGANIDSVNQNKETPLHLSVKASLDENVQVALKYCPNKTMCEYENLFVMLTSDRTLDKKAEKILKLLLEYGFTVPKTVATTEGHLLFRAVELRYAEFLRHLLQQGADPNYTNGTETILEKACSDVSTSPIAKILLQHGAEVDKSPKAFSHAIGTLRDLNLLKMLFEKGCAPNMAELLFKATRMGILDILQFLLESGKPKFNVDSVFIEKMTIEINEGRYTEFFIENQTLAYEAIARGHKDILELLCKYGADVNIKDGRGNTLLHSAVLQGWPDCVSPLLNFGADVNIANNQNSTPVDLIRNFGFPPVIKDLRNHIMALHSLGILVSKEALSLISPDDGEITRKYSELSTEISLMKNTKIGNTFVSIYNFVTCSENRRVLYMRNKELTESLQSCMKDYVEIFPNFIMYLKRRIVVSSRRLALFEEAITHLTTDFEFFANLPTHCLEHILLLLSDNELSILNKHPLPGVFFIPCQTRVHVVL